MRRPLFFLFFFAKELNVIPKLSIVSYRLTIRIGLFLFLWLLGISESIAQIQPRIYRITNKQEGAAKSLSFVNHRPTLVPSKDTTDQYWRITMPLDGSYRLRNAGLGYFFLWIFTWCERDGG